MKHVRFLPIETCDLQVRQTDEGQQSREIEGRPIVFGVRSVNLTPWSSTRVVYEVLEPGCITNELLQRSDVILNLNHSTKVQDVLGRYRGGKGTLELTLNGDHVGCRCDFPYTTNANDALTLIRRGDINGMSFAFEDNYRDSENGVSYELTEEVVDKKEVWIRHVKQITALHDVSIVTHPAYACTSVLTREMSDDIEAAIDSQLKRSQESKSEEGKTDESGNKTDETEKENNKERARSLTLLRKRLSLENIIE